MNWVVRKADWTAARKVQKMVGQMAAQSAEKTVD